jgi:hypothetical protein
MVDAASSVNDAIFRLGFASLADCTANGYVTPTELYQFADDAVKHLSYKAGIFIGLDASVPVTAGVGAYNLPSNHVFTLMAWVAPEAGVGGSNQILRATPVGSLFALDATWATTSGESKRYSLDAGSVGTITLYPVPVTSGTLNQICQQFPTTVTAAASQVAAMPSVLQDYLTYAMLAGGRGKESDSAMPEMAAHFRGRLSLYDQVIEHLWGPGQ